MYSVDRKVRVVELPDIPDSCSGSPQPQVRATEDSVVASYLTPDHKELAEITFRGMRGHYFGGPNDETLSGHPLYKHGLRFYKAYEVMNSAWIREMMQRNRVHRQHSDSMFAKDRHFILTFHDSMFECVAKGYEVTKTTNLSRA